MCLSCQRDSTVPFYAIFFLLFRAPSTSQITHIVTFTGVVLAGMIVDNNSFFILVDLFSVYAKRGILAPYSMLLLSDAEMNC